MPRLLWNLLLLLGLLSAGPALGLDEDGGDDDEPAASRLFQIEGKIFPPDLSSLPATPGSKPASKASLAAATAAMKHDWFWQTRVIVDGGNKVGFVKEDNTFTVSGLPSGSYLVEVVHPDFYYEPVRVEINSKGKIRARKVNQVQPTQVTQVTYPLKLKTPGRFRYFQKREEWKVTDMLMNPMILMMVLPLLLITVLPKMMNDPDTKREMEQMQQNMNVQNQVPEMSEILTNMFGGGSTERKKKAKAIRR